MSNLYIKIDNDSSNIADLNTLNAAGLTSKDQVDYISKVIQCFWNSTGVTKTKVWEAESLWSGNEKRYIAIPNGVYFILFEIDPADYISNKALIDEMNGLEIYENIDDFKTAYPLVTLVDITIKE